MRALLTLAALGAAAFGLDSGKLPAKWTPSGPDCSSFVPWQVHEYNANLWIIRQSGCTNYEKPFLYLIFGRDRALLQDTGAGETDIDELVPRLLTEWAMRNGRDSAPPLLVVHSHSHGDHTSGDAKLAALPNTTVIPAKPDAIENALAMPGWPTRMGVIDLGERVIDAIPIPGHDAADLALYDRKTGLLLTGDTLYPGRLYVRNFPAYQASIARLVKFTESRPVAHILGTHIEQSRTPFVDYKVRTVYQPEELPLEMTREDLLAVHEGLAGMVAKPSKLALARFTIVPLLRMN